MKRTVEIKINKKIFNFSVDCRLPNVAVMAYNQRVLAWGEEEAVPRAPRQERPPGPGHPGHPAAPPRPPRPQEELELEAERSEDAEDFLFCGGGHPELVLAGLEELRKERRFTDVRIAVDTEQFSVHKCVLSSFSPYFRAMFTTGLAESGQEEVRLQGVEPAMIASLIDYAYTGQININKQNVQSLLSAANLLEVLPVRDACCQFLDRNMDETNCLGIHCFAEVHSCTDLMNKAKKFVLKHFQEICEGEEFINISEAKLIEIISSDDLEIDKEETVFHACIKWLNSQQRVPKSFHPVLEHIRLPLLTPYFIHDVVVRCPAVSESPDCRALVEEARLYHLLPDRRSSVSGERTRARRSAGTSQVIVSVGGEDDKVVLRSVEFWDPATRIWKTLACLPFAVSKHGLVVSGQGKMYMAGGEYPDGSASRAVWRYDPVLNAWQEMADMRVPRSELGLAMLGKQPTTSEDLGFRILGRPSFEVCNIWKTNRHCDILSVKRCCCIGR